MMIGKPIHLARINAFVRLSSIKFRVICLAKTVFFPINFATMQAWESWELSSQHNRSGTMQKLQNINFLTLF